MTRPPSSSPLPRGVELVRGGAVTGAVFGPLDVSLPEVSDEEYARIRTLDDAAELVEKHLDLQAV